MINFVKGNIFDSQAEALVCPVNCVGVMGAGLALAFKNYSRGNYDYYRASCASGWLVPGRVLTFKQADGSYIINFPTKNHWKSPSKMEWILSGMDALLVDIHKFKIKSVAIPAIGCGLGGLKWEDVKKVIVHYLENSSVINLWDLEVEIYEPG